MSVIEFPAADRPITENEIDKLHAEAFRDLEPGICDLDRMGEIALGLMSDVLNAPDNQRRIELAFFATEKLADMLGEFKVDYYAAWEGKRVSP
jgi:hypothetical protein